MSDPYSPYGKEGPVGPGGPDSTGAAPQAGVGGPSEPGPETTSTPPPPHSPRPPFPWMRLLYAIGFAVVAWVMFWLIVLLLAPLQFITIAIAGKPNEELKHMSLRAMHYLVELLVFITGARDEKPFPLGPFPKV